MACDVRSAPFWKVSNKRRCTTRFGVFFRKAELYIRYLRRLLRRLTPDFAPHKMLYGSLMGGVAFGMLTMISLEHFLGPGVFARATPETAVQMENADASPETPVYNKNGDIFFEYFGVGTDSEYEANVRAIVKGYPIEAMLPEIFKQDRIVAAFLIGIAKKESNWGLRVPVLEDQDCFNYWGYRGQRRLMGTGGHTCFNSRKDAVDTVAKRLDELINSEKLNTPEKLVVWKCGFSCEGHNRSSVQKWISDVDHYYTEAMEATPEDEKGL
ncbi:MAG: hypothetical protein WDN67_03655 [Candidatus Moraniibacteriota bacterium]